MPVSGLPVAVEAVLESLMAQYHLVSWQVAGGDRGVVLTLRWSLSASGAGGVDGPSNSRSPQRHPPDGPQPRRRSHQHQHHGRARRTSQWLMEQQQQQKDTPDSTLSSTRSDGRQNALNDPGWSPPNSPGTPHRAVGKAVDYPDTTIGSGSSYDTAYDSPPPLPPPPPLPDSSGSGSASCGSEGESLATGETVIENPNWRRLQVPPTKLPPPPPPAPPDSRPPPPQDVLPPPPPTDHTPLPPQDSFPPPPPPEPAPPQPPPSKSLFRGLIMRNRPGIRKMDQDRTAAPVQQRTRSVSPTPVPVTPTGTPGDPQVAASIKNRVAYTKLIGKAHSKTLLTAPEPAVVRTENVSEERAGPSREGQAREPPKQRYHFRELIRKHSVEIKELGAERRRKERDRERLREQEKEKAKSRLKAHSEDNLLTLTRENQQREEKPQTIITEGSLRSKSEASISSKNVDGARRVRFSEAGAILTPEDDDVTTEKELIGETEEDVEGLGEGTSAEGQAEEEGAEAEEDDDSGDSSDAEEIGSHSGPRRLGSMFRIGAFVARQKRRKKLVA